MNKLTRNSPIKRPRWLIVLVLVVAVGALLWGIGWVTFARQPLPEAVEALESNERVTVSYDPWMTFSPAQDDPSTGFIFYPGGRIDPQGYASLMSKIAYEGYLVVVPEMPLNMAAFRPNIADKIIPEYPNISQWVIGGHSLGGAMAAQYTYTHNETIDGLVIWASYPPENANLSDLEIPVVLIYGSRETRVTDTSVAERRHLLPADTIYVRIEGGDHHQFGDYEIDPQDHRATISRDLQHDEILQPTVNLLSAVSESN